MSLKVKVVDPFNGITVDPSALPKSTEEFSVLLKKSLEEWKKAGRRGIWLKLPTPEFAHLLPVALENGFVLHHCKPSYILVTNWLQKEQNKLPGFASHQVGVGGFVVNDKGQILMVRERYLLSKMWKFPGGLVNDGESLPEAAKREVFEETGIKTEFVSLVGFRHLPKMKARFGIGDLYFVCKLRPLNTEIVPEREEIAEAKWMAPEEYLAHPFTPKLMKSFISRDYENPGVVPEQIPALTENGQQYLYHVSENQPALKARL